MDRRENGPRSPLDVDGLDLGLTAEEILEHLNQGRRVVEFRGFLEGIDSYVEREPDRV